MHLLNFAAEGCHFQTTSVSKHLGLPRGLKGKGRSLKQNREPNPKGGFSLQRIDFLKTKTTLDYVVPADWERIKVKTGEEKKIC